MLMEISLPTNPEELSRLRKKRKPRAPEKGNVLEFQINDSVYTKR